MAVWMVLDYLCFFFVFFSVEMVIGIYENDL